MTLHNTKRFLLLLLVAGGIVFSACTGKNTKEAAEAFQQGYADANGDNASSDVKQPEWSVNGNTLTYGSHTYTMQGNIDFDFVEGAKASVTFTNVPSDLQEFRTVYEQLLGKTIYGVCAMMPMAFELWGRDHQTGEQALQMICGSSCYNEVMRQLPDHMQASEYAPANDTYAQRCLPAALLQGATKENGYNPTEPYTVNIAIGRPENWGPESEMLQADLYQLDILTENAWNTPKRSITVMLPWNGDDLFKVNSCPALYINIFAPRKEWNGLK